MSRAPRAAVDPRLAAAGRRLDTLARHAPELASAIALQRAVLPHLQVVGGEPAPMDAASAQTGLATGQPLLLSQGLVFDGQAAAARFHKLARAIETAIGPSKAPVRAIRVAAERDTLALPRLWQVLAAADDTGLRALAAEHGLEAAWLRLLGTNCLRPVLRALAEAAEQTLDVAGWQRGHCPICASAPLLAEVRGKEGARYLRCGLCSASWPYPRLKCAFCRATRPHSLGYLCLEGEGEKYRVQTCAACQGYLKVVVTFEPIPADQLAAEDLATLHLDGLAAERGFARVAVRA